MQHGERRSRTAFFVRCLGPLATAVAEVMGRLKLSGLALHAILNFAPVQC